MLDGYAHLKKSRALFEHLYFFKPPFYFWVSVVQYEVPVLNLTSSPYLAIYPPDFSIHPLVLSSFPFPRFLMRPPSSLYYLLFVVSGTIYKYTICLDTFSFQVPVGKCLTQGDAILDLDRGGQGNRVTLIVIPTKSCTYLTSILDTRIKSVRACVCKRKN